MSDSHPVVTPIEASFDRVELYTPRTPEEERVMAKVPYREAVGSLLYAMVCTRFDIAFAVGIVSRFMQAPKPIHWALVKRIFRYLKGTSEFGIVFKREGSQQEERKMKAFADASYASDINTRKSITGILVKLFGGMVFWSSKKQATVALSTTEAEYMGLSATTEEVIWQRLLLKELGEEQVEATVIAQDNQGAICLSTDPTNHSRVKHIDVRHHFIRECVESGAVVTSYCPTKEMLADMCTKALPGPSFANLRSQSGMIPV